MLNKQKKGIKMEIFFEIGNTFVNIEHINWIDYDKDEMQEKVFVTIKLSTRTIEVTFDSLLDYQLFLANLKDSLNIVAKVVNVENVHKRR